jgi:Tfp pilus assembly protein PilO
MSINGIIRAIFKRDLTKREGIIVFLTVLAIVGALVYRFPYLSLKKSVNALAANVVATERNIRALSVQIADIKAHEEELKAGLKTGVAGWELVDQRGALLFLDDVSSEARRQGVSLIAVHPSQEIDKEKYKEVSMNLDLKGRYRELAEYFRHLENLSRIVSIRKIRVEACPDSSSACATQLEAVTYMSK